MSHKSIHDNEFDQLISLRDSYRVMYEFLFAFNERGEISTQNLVDFVGLLEGGSSSDPAQIYDYLDAVKKVASEDKI